MWHFRPSVQLVLITLSITRGRNGYNKTQTVPCIWIARLDADCCQGTAKNLMLLGAKAKQANTGSRAVGRQNSSMRSKRAYQVASFGEPGSWSSVYITNPSTLPLPAPLPVGFAGRRMTQGSGTVGSLHQHARHSAAHPAPCSTHPACHGHILLGTMQEDS